MKAAEGDSFPLQDVVRVLAGILALVILLLSYIGDAHVNLGVSGYICKSAFAFSMSLGAVLLIIGSFSRIAAGVMIAGLWMGYYAMLLGTSLLIPASFSLVLLGVVINGPGRYTWGRIINSKDF